MKKMDAELKAIQQLTNVLDTVPMRRRSAVLQYVMTRHGQALAETEMEEFRKLTAVKAASENGRRVLGVDLGRLSSPPTPFEEARKAVDESGPRESVPGPRVAHGVGFREALPEPAFAGAGATGPGPDDGR